MSVNKNIKLAKLGQTASSTFLNPQKSEYCLVQIITARLFNPGFRRLAHSRHRYVILSEMLFDGKTNHNATNLIYICG